MTNANRLYVTIHGLPLTFDLTWPFHSSTSGADFDVLHGTVWVVGEEGLRAEVAVHVAKTVREVLPSLAPEDAQDVVINALRKQVDQKQLEFLRSSKRQPVPLSARFTNFKTKHWHFMSASEADIALMLRDRVYWSTKVLRAPVPMADACEAMYVGTTVETLKSLAQTLAREELVQVVGDGVVATELLLAMGQQIEERSHAALDELLRKHAFEQIRAS